MNIKRPLLVFFLIVLPFSNASSQTHYTIIDGKTVLDLSEQKETEVFFKVYNERCNWQDTFRPIRINGYQLIKDEIELYELLPVENAKGESDFKWFPRHLNKHGVLKLEMLRRYYDDPVNAPSLVRKFKIKSKNHLPLSIIVQKNQTATQRPYLYKTTTCGN